MLLNTILPAIKKELKGTIALSLPLIASQLIYSISSFMGVAMVARFGEAALAASVLVSMIWVTLSMLFFGMINSISILIAHQYSARNITAIGEIMGQAGMLGIIISILMTLTLYSIPFFLKFFIQPSEVLVLSTQYMYSLLFITPGLIALLISEQFLAGVNRAKLILYISLLTVPVEILMLYALIFGKWGLPICGIAGIGYGFAISQTIAAIAVFIYLSRSKQYQVFNLFKRHLPVENVIGWVWLREMVRIGFPMGLMQVIEVGGFTVATFWIKHFGTTLLAAHQIIIQYLNFVMTLIFSMSQAVTIRVGYAVGANHLLGVYCAAYGGMVMTFITILLIAIAFVLWPTLFIQLDINIHQASNRLLLQQTSTLLAISGVLMLFDNIRLITFGALRALKDTYFPMYISLIGFWIVGLSCSYLLGFIFKYEGNGIWWGLTIGIASCAGILLIRLQWLLKHVNLKNIATRIPNLASTRLP